jgi:Protein of unknown function (DUF4232)
MRSVHDFRGAVQIWRGIGLVAALLAGFLGFAPVGAGSATGRTCQASDFKLSRGPSASALAHYRQTVRLRNVSNATCSMAGWFEVRLLDAHGKVLPAHEQKITSDMFGTSPKSALTVKPGAGASFAIDTTAPATSCPYSKAISITPPGGHGSMRLDMAVLACAHFSVLPVQPDNHAIH